MKLWKMVILLKSITLDSTLRVDYPSLEMRHIKYEEETALPGTMTYI